MCICLSDSNEFSPEIWVQLKNDTNRGTKKEKGDSNMLRYGAEYDENFLYMPKHEPTQKSIHETVLSTKYNINETPHQTHQVSSN